MIEDADGRQQFLGLGVLGQPIAAALQQNKAGGTLSPTQDRKNLIREVFENKLSICKAAKKVGLNNSTAKVVIRKHRKELKDKENASNRDTSIEGEKNSGERRI